MRQVVSCSCDQSGKALIIAHQKVFMLNPFTYFICLVKYLNSQVFDLRRFLRLTWPICSWIQSWERTTFRALPRQSHTHHIMMFRAFARYGCVPMVPPYHLRNRPRLSDFSPKLQDKIQNREPGFEARCCVCWCVCGVGYASEQKTTQKSISKEEEADSCMKKADFCSEVGPRKTFFVLVLSMLAFKCCLPTRRLWRKESSYWWDHVVNSTFSAHDWLENFHMSQARGENQLHFE